MKEIINEITMFNLIDYKGKTDFIQDKDCIDFEDTIVGEITLEEAKQQLKVRMEEAIYYGIPVYIGKNKELLDLIEGLQKN